MSQNAAKRLSKAAFGFSDIIMVQSMDLKLQYIDRLVGCVKSHERSYLALTVLRQILRKTFENNIGSKHPEIETLAEMVAHIEKKHNLFDAVFADLQHYCEKAGRELEKGRDDLADRSEVHKTVIVDDFMHADQIAERLDFIAYYAAAGSQVKISAEQLASIWDTLVVKSAVEHDKKIVYGWLRGLCDKFQHGDTATETSASRVVMIDDLLAFFRKSIVNEKDQSLLQDLSLEGFHCVQSFFILINSLAGKLRRVTEDDAAYKGKHLQKEDEQPQDGKLRSKSFDVGMDVACESEVKDAEEGKKKTDTAVATTSTGTGPDKPQAAFTAFGSDTGAVYQDLDFKGKSGDDNQIDTSGKGPSTPKAKSTAVGDSIVYGPQLPGAAVPLADKEKYVGKQEEKQKKIDPDDIQLEVFVPPTELEGVDLLWRIGTESVGKAAIDAAAKLLVQIHHDVGGEVEGRLPEFDDIFINKCLEIIAEQRPLIEQRSAEEQEAAAAELAKLPTTASQIQTLMRLPRPERRVIRVVFLLKQMIRASEKLGTHGVRPHASLTKGTSLPTLQVANNVTPAADTARRGRFEVAAYTSTTLWELKRLLGQELAKTSLDGGKTWAAHPDPTTGLPPAPAHPATLRVYQMSSQKDIKDVRNGDTLKEINFGKAEQLSMYRKNAFLTRRAQLLYDDEAGNAVWTARAATVLNEIFDKYSEHREDLGKRVMTKEHAIRYTADCTRQESGADDRRVRVLMCRYSFCGTKWENDEPVQIEGQELLLDAEAFQRFCKDAVLAGKEERLRNNLRQLGYNNDLSRAPNDGEDENILQLRKSLEAMPRHKVAQKEPWEALMALLELRNDLGGHVQTRALELVRMLATQPQLYRTVLELSDDWKSIFDASKSANHVQYALEIIEAIMNGETGESDVELVAWLRRFVDLGGVEELQRQLRQQLESADAGSGKKRLVDQLLKLLRVFIISAAPADKKDEILAGSASNEAEKKAESPNVAKKVSFATEDAAAAAPDTENITQETLFGDQPYTADAADSGVKKDEPQDASQMLRIQRAMSSGVSDGVLARIDMPGLQALMLRTVDFLLLGSATEDLPKEDRHIVESAMNLWARLGKACGKPVEVDKDFLLRGLTAKEVHVRESFETSLKELAGIGAAQRDILFETLTDLLADMEAKHREGKVKLARAQPFFGALHTLLSDRLEARAVGADDPGILGLAKKCLLLAVGHESGETRTSFLKDSLLVGYLEVLATVIGSARADLPEKREPEEEWSAYATSVFALVEGPLAEGSKRSMLDFIFDDCLFQHDMIDGEMKLSKCCSVDARQAGFAVVENYVKLLRPHEMATFLGTHLLPLLNSCPRPEKWRYKPSSGGRVHSHCGIVNLGCICYMISMLQQFFMVPQFRYQLLKAVDESPETLVEYKGQMIDDNLLRQLQQLFGHLELSAKQAAQPGPFAYALKDYFGDRTRVGEQKDSQEFINLFCDRIEELLKPTSQRHLLRDVFCGHRAEELCCPVCGHVSTRLEQYYNLSIQIKGLSDIHESLQAMADGEIIEGYECSGCKKRVNIQKRALLADTPNTLIVHLNRIMYSFDIDGNDKINTYFAFPQLLNLKPYSYKAHRSGEAGKVAHPELLEVDDDDYIYRLVGVNIHSGSADAGHYYSLIDIKRGAQEPDPLQSDESLKEWQNVEADAWKEFNDSTVSSFDLKKKLEEEAFGTKDMENTNATSDAMTDEQLAAFLSGAAGGQSRTYGKSAYMLVYERKSKKPLRVIETKDGKEEEALVPFRSVEKYVPPDICSQAVADNKAFIVDHNMFADSTFNFVKGVLKHINSDLIMTGYQYPHAYSSVHFDNMKGLALEVSGKVLYDMLVHYEHNIMINEVSAAIETILTFSDSQYKVVEGAKSAVSAFVRKWVLDERDHFLKTLYNCTDLVARKYASNVAAHALNRLFSIYYRTDPAKRANSEAIIEVKKTIDEVFEMIFAALHDKDCLKAWARLDGLFRLIESQATKTLSQSQYLLERDGDVIADLIDFILGNASPRMANVRDKRYTMGGSITAPPFQPLYVAISRLIRHTHTAHMDLEKRLPTHATVAADKDGKPKFEGDFEEYKTYGLSEEAANMIQYTDFIEKPMFDGKFTDNKEYAAALAHLSYNDLEFSARIIGKLLKAVSYADNDAIKRHLVIVDALARVADDFQERRLEMLFGCAFLMNVRDPSNPELPQYGTMAGALNSLESLYTYGTPLDSEQADDCLLGALLKSAKGMLEGFTRTCLHTLCTLVVEDENIAAYFAKLPSVDYSAGYRYTDWIKPFLEGRLTENAKLITAPGAEKNAEDIMKVIDLIETYEKMQKEKETAKELQYVIVESVSQKEVGKEVLADGQLTVEIHQTACEWVEAPPAGQPAIDAVRLCALKAARFQQPQEPQDKGEQPAAVGAVQAPAPVEYEPFAVCEDALFRYSITNVLTDNVAFDFRFRETGDSNLVVPRGVLRDYMKAVTSNTLITLRKRDISKPADLSALSFEILDHQVLKSGTVQIGKYASATNKPVTYSATAVPSTDTDTASKPVVAGRRNGVILNEFGEPHGHWAASAATAVSTDVQTNVGEFQAGDTQAADADSAGPSNYVEVAPASSGKKICPMCQYANEPDHAFCLSCYADLA